MLAGPCFADEPHVDVSGWPSLFKVVDVAPDDQLNIRAAPDVSSEVLGSFAYDAKGIEVVGRAKGTPHWARVNFREGAGWVNTRFLSQTSEAKDPVSYICFGTEPFWAFSDRVPAGFKFQFPDADQLLFRRTAEGRSQNRPNRYFVTGANPEGTFGAVLRAEQCSDGMSDRDFAISIDIGLFGDAGSTFLSGCCSIAP